MEGLNVMKIKEGFILKSVADSFVVVPTGANIVDFSAMITLNETGAFLWETLKNDVTEEKLTSALMSEYEVDKETADEDVAEFVSVLREKKVIE